METTDQKIKQTHLFRLFSQYLHPELVKHGFEVQSNAWIDVSVRRFGIRYKKKVINWYGYSYEHTIDFIGMPMGSSLILCYGLIEGSDEVDAKIKIKSNENVDDVVKRFTHKFIYKLIERISTGLCDMPLEIKLLLCTYLTVEDIVRLSLVNKEWNMICTVEEALWKKRLVTDFPHDAELLIQRPIKFSWRKAYQQIYVRKKRCWEERGLTAPIQLLALPDIPRMLPIAFPPLYAQLQLPALPDVLALPW